MGLSQDMRNQPVSTLDLRELLTGTPDMSVAEAVDLMQRKRLGCVTVVENDQPIGVFTEFLLIKLLLHDPDAMQRSLRDVMQLPCPTIAKTGSIGEAVRSMRDQGLRFVVVVDEQDGGKPVALTGQKGVMEYVAEHYPQLVLNQRVGDRPYMNQREGA